MVQFRVDVVVDPRGAAAGAKKVGDRLQGVQNRADALRASLKRAFLILGGGVLLFSSIRTLARFEQSMSTVQAVTGATAQEFARLRATAQELGITTRFTATQAADAMVNLARAGFSVAESIEAVDDTLNLAQAGGLGLAQASDIAASALRGFRLATDQAGRVTDVLTKAANSANTTVGQLGEAIKFVAPVAAGLNIELEQTAAALGVLSDAGLKATLAGTGLRRVLAELESPSNNTQKILASLGVTADQVKVSQVGLIDALDALKQSGIDTGTALEVFGQRGGPAFEVLVNNIPRIREMTDVLENAGGTAAEVAKIMDDNLNGALLRVKSAFEGVILAFGETGATNTLTNSFNVLATSMRFVADNADLALAAMVPFVGFLAVKGTASVLGFGASVAKLNPILLAGSAVVASVQLAFASLRREVDAAQKALDNLADDARFVEMGSAISTAQRELNKLARIQKEQGFLSETQQARVEQLTGSMERQREVIRKQADAQRNLKVAQDGQKVSIENTLAALDRKAQLLKLNNRETEIQAGLEEKINQLLSVGIIPDAAAKAGLENRLRLIQGLKDQARILEEIRGPQEQFKRDQFALNSLMLLGAITADEYHAKLAELKSGLEEVGAEDPFKTQIESLREANDLLQIRIRSGQPLADFQRILNDLERQGVEINEDVREAVRKQVLRKQELLAEQEKLNDKQREENELARQRTQLAEREQQRIEGMARRVNLIDQLIERNRLLEEVERQGLITSEQLGQAQEVLLLRALEASTALADGFSRAFLKISREAEDLAAVAESVVNVFARSGVDALTEFSRTGQLKVKELASSILDDLTRIIARLLVVQSLSAVFGGFGLTPTVGGGSLSGLAEGGTTQPGRSFLVGEKGVPEIFTPDRTGTVTPIAAQQAPPQVNVSITNVQDPQMIPAAIEAGDADDAIVNVLGRNPQKVNRILGNS